METPVWLELNGSPSCTWLCTPSLLDALTCGWLNGEGLISDRRELLELEVDADERWVKARTARRLVVQKTLVAGPERSIAEGIVIGDDHHAEYTISQSGTLAYLSGTSAFQRRLART